MANSQCLNRYSYCLNNPLKYTDPSGYEVVIEGMSLSEMEALLNSGDYMGILLFANQHSQQLQGELFQAYVELATVAPELTGYLEKASETISVEWNEVIIAAAQIHSTQGNDAYLYVNDSLKRADSRIVAAAVGHEAFHGAEWIGLGHPNGNWAANEAFAYSLQSAIEKKFGITPGWIENMFSDINPYMPKDQLNSRLNQDAQDLCDIGYSRPKWIFWTQPLKY